MSRDGAAIEDQSGKHDNQRCSTLTNLAFLRHVTTSDGNVEETWGCVVVADASQFSGCCWTVAMVGQPKQ